MSFVFHLWNHDEGKTWHCEYYITQTTNTYAFVSTLFGMICSLFICNKNSTTRLWSLFNVLPALKMCHILSAKSIQKPSSILLDLLYTVFDTSSLIWTLITPQKVVLISWLGSYCSDASPKHWKYSSSRLEVVVLECICELLVIVDRNANIRMQELCLSLFVSVCLSVCLSVSLSLHQLIKPWEILYTVYLHKIILASWHSLFNVWLFFRSWLHMHHISVKIYSVSIRRIHWLLKLVKLLKSN